MKKIIASSIIGILVLTSCGKAPEAPVAIDKVPFPIQTQSIKDFPSTYTINKTGRMVGSSNISLTAQGVGRVDAVLVKEGTFVKKWQVLVRLRDTTANYDLKLSQANNTLSSAKNNTESTRLSLEKAIDDTYLALVRAENDLRATEITATKNLEKAVRDTQNSNLSTASNASITLDQLQSSLDKAKLDRDNLIIANHQTIANYAPTYENLVNDLKKFYTKILFEEDRRFGFTTKFLNETSSARSYLGARLPSSRSTLEVAYRDFEKSGLELNTLPTSVNEQNLLTELDRLNRMYQVARAYFNASGVYIENSIISSNFSQAQLDGYIAVNNWYKTELSGLESAETSFRNGAATFLANYRNNEASAAAALSVQEKNIEVQKRQLQTTSFDTSLSLDKLRTSNEQAITTAKIAVQSAQMAYENAQENKTVTLKKLSLSESDAALSIAQAREELGKLSIVAPIDGSITRVITSVGQEVSGGTPVLELANKNPEITFDVEASIVPLLKAGSSQVVKYQGSSYTGTVVGVSQVATDSLLYSARIILSDTTLLLWQVASIELNIPSTHPVLPTDIIKVISDKRGEIQTLSGGTIVPLEVELGRIAGDRVEVTSTVDPSIQIITSNVLNFDSRKSEIIVENAEGK